VEWDAVVTHNGDAYELSICVESLIAEFELVRNERDVMWLLVSV
jgi:hypothetical protein